MNTFASLISSYMKEDAAPNVANSSQPSNGTIEAIGVASDCVGTHPIDGMRSDDRLLLTEGGTSGSFSYKQVDSLPYKVKQQLSDSADVQVKFLQLHGNRFSELPLEIARMWWLQDLNMSMCRLTSLSHAFQTLTRLRDLDLSDNQISSVTPAVAALNEVSCLHLHSNCLKTVPEELFSLSVLRKLSLHTNQLDDLPESSRCFEELTWLSLNNNKLTHIPPCWYRGPKLVRVCYHINKLTSVPAEVGAMVSVEAASWHRNELAELPPSIGGLKTLAELALFMNQLEAMAREQPLAAVARESMPYPKLAATVCRGQQADSAPRGH